MYCTLANNEREDMSESVTERIQAILPLDEKALLREIGRSAFEEGYGKGEATPEDEEAEGQRYLDENKGRLMGCICGSSVASRS